MPAGMISVKSVMKAAVASASSPASGNLRGDVAEVSPLAEPAFDVDVIKEPLQVLCETVPIDQPSLHDTDEAARHSPPGKIATS